MNLKKIDANIALVRVNGNAFNVLVHETIIGILEHAQKSGDCTRALTLVEAMPKSTKRGAVINTFADYSPIGMNLKERKVRFHKPDAKAYKPFDIKGAKANPWYEREEVNKEDLPDTTLEQAQKYIFSLASKLQKRVDEGEVAANDREGIESVIVDLKALGTKRYHAAKAAKAAAAAKPAAARKAA
jgi:hypothetical protein